MFNEIEFRSLAIKKGIKIPQIAKAIGVSTPTLYRKMSGESDFYRAEIQAICDLFEEKDLNYIFFSWKLLKSNKRRCDMTHLIKVTYENGKTTRN